MTFDDWLAGFSDRDEYWDDLEPIPESFEVALPHRIVTAPRPPVLEEIQRPLSFDHGYKRMCRAVICLAVSRPCRMAMITGITAREYGGETIYPTFTS